jgi:LPXTG-motif cell wall-anchored protein
MKENIAGFGIHLATERRKRMPDSSTLIRIVAGVLALVVLGIIIYRRKNK